jgi:hypothetical protein
MLHCSIGDFIMAHTAQDRFGFAFDTAPKPQQQRKARFDPFGIVSGFKAYWIYSDLAERSDAQLAAMGMERCDLAHIAIEKAQRA